MRKNRIVLLSLLALVLAVSCALAVACNKTEKFKVTWDLDDQVQSVAIDGDYEYASEMELEKDTEVTFSVTFKTGYEAQTVKAGNTVIRPSNGKYKFTVTADTKITVTSKKILNSITVERVDDTKVYYAGQKVLPEDLVVTAHWATNEDEPVTGYTISYANGKEALSIGDTSFTVSYLGKSTVVELYKDSESAIVGKITLDLRGGTLAPEDLAQLPGNYTLKDSVITWTFDKAFEADMVLPSATRIINDVNCPFVRWSGVEEGKIPEGNEVSVEAIAIYNIPLVELSNMAFTEKEGVPYLIIEGKLVAVDNVKLIFVEGKQHIQYDKHFEAKKVGDVTTFTIEVNLAELAKATPVYFGENEEEEGKNLPTSFKGPWLDIRFVADNNGEILQQELIVEEDDDYTNVADAIVAKVDNDWLRFTFKTWGPAAGDFITGGNGATFTGTELILKLYYSDCPDLVVDYADLVEKDNKAWLVLHGQYVDKKGEATKEQVEKILQDLVASDKSKNDCSIEGYSYWDRATTTKAYTIEEDLTWTISFALDGTQHGHGYYVHFNNENLVARTEAKSVKIGPVEYTLMNDIRTDNWTSGLVWVKVFDESAKTLTYTNATLEQQEDKVYLVLTANFALYTEDELKTITYYEGNKDTGEVKNGMTVTVEKVVITGDTVKLYFNITDVNANGEWWWGHWTINGGAKGDVNCEITEIEIVENGKKYAIHRNGTIYFVVTNA